MLTVLSEKLIPQEEGKASMHSSHEDYLSILASSDYQAHSIPQICPNFRREEVVIFLPTKVTLKNQWHYQNIL